MESKRFTLVFGYIFLFLGIFDLILKISLYGFMALDFLWFCSISIFILALGMILKNAMLLNSFLSISLLVQPFWILDYVWLTFFNVPLNGVSSFVFRPGYTLEQFIINARHMYMIPFGLFCVFTISQKNKRSYFFIPAFIILLLGSTYLFTPRESNLNCAFEPCLDMFKMRGLPYFFLYTIIIIVVSLLINLIINTFLEKFQGIGDKIYYKRILIGFFLLLLLLSTLSVAFAYLKYSKIPKFECLKSEECVDCTVDIKCDYIDVSSENLAVSYTIKNYGEVNYVCNVSMRIYPTDDDYKQIVDNSFIEAYKKYEVGQSLPYPNVNSQVRLKPSCKVYP